MSCTKLIYLLEDLIGSLSYRHVNGSIICISVNYFLQFVPSDFSLDDDPFVDLSDTADSQARFSVDLNLLSVNELLESVL
jgi:hypothetical protein